MVAVFDTAFHQTMPAYAYLALPYEIREVRYKKMVSWHIHRYVSEGSALLGIPLSKLKIISCTWGMGQHMCHQVWEVSGNEHGLYSLDGLAMGWVLR